MLERFHVPKKDQVKVSEKSIRLLVEQLFEKLGVPKKDAVIAADVLITADLRGVESHGISNMLSKYVEYYQDGTFNAKPNWKTVSETTNTAVIAADRAHGIIIGHYAMNSAINKARKHNIGIVNIFNRGHMGPIGHFPMMAAQEDMIGICAISAGTGILPTFAAEPRLGTNPIAFAAPGEKEAPFLFDAATSAIANNKIVLAIRMGASLLPGWIGDLDGTPIMEEKKVDHPKKYPQLLFGGTRELGSHKAYGLSLFIEIISSLLSGEEAGMVSESKGVANPTNEYPEAGTRTFLAAINISSFTEVAGFKKRMDKMLRMLLDTPPSPGNDRVIYPGVVEHEEYQDRIKNGIPYHKDVVAWLETAIKEFNLPKLEIF